MAEPEITIQLSSKYEDLNKSVVMTEAEDWVDYHKEMLFEGTLHLHMHKHRETKKNKPLLLCRAKLDVGPVHMHIQDEGFGEEQATKNALQKLREQIVKKKGELQDYHQKSGRTIGSWDEKL